MDGMSAAVAAAIGAAPCLQAARLSLAALRARGAHALLLHGPAGTGKWQAAMAFAGELLCERPGAAACGQCDSCRLMAAGNHPDLRVIVPDALAERRPGQGQEEGEAEAPAAGSETTGKTKPSREIKIDQVRDLVSLSALTAHRGGARVVVLGPAEALNLPAANALLKGLEEPPPNLVFLLVSDQIDRCLPTILSRCALVRVPVPPRELALQWLREQGAGAQAPARLLAAGGAPVAALRGSDDDLPPDLAASLVALLRRGAALEPAEVASAVPRTVAIGPAVDLFQRWGWDYFAYRTGGSLRYHPADEASFAALARHWRLSCAGAWIDTLVRLRAVADHPLNARSAVEAALLDYIESIRAS